RARRGALARRPRPRDLRRPDRPRVSARRERGGPRHRDDGRRPRGGAGLTDAPHPPPKPADAVPSVAARLAFYQRASGIVTPFLTAAVAFFIGGLVVLVTTHKNPLNTYREIFNGTGLNWPFPLVHGAQAGR